MTALALLALQMLMVWRLASPFTAGTRDRRTGAAEPVSILLDGNMKIGQWTQPQPPAASGSAQRMALPVSRLATGARLALAFEDLILPLPGLSITVTRSYDSRHTDSADFGVGWDLAPLRILLAGRFPPQPCKQ